MPLLCPHEAFLLEGLLNENQWPPMVPACTALCILQRHDDRAHYRLIDVRVRCTNIHQSTSDPTIGDERSTIRVSQSKP